MPTSRVIGRIVALTAVVVGVIVIAVLLLGGSSPYKVKAYFTNASQLVKGNLVQVAGANVGKVVDLTLTPNGQAQVTMQITDGNYKPLHQETIATVRQASLSGVANRYIDLRLPSGEKPSIPNNGVIPASSTSSAVDLDQLFDTFDPQTRKALSGVIQGFSTIYAKRGPQLNQGYQYLNPVLASSSRLFSELNYDTPALTQFVVANSKVVTDLAAKQSEISGLVDHLATTTGAIASQKAALASSLQQLPAFFRRADTTFVNLRAILNDLDPLVNESKPVAKRLRPFLAQLRPLAREARPTLRDLSRLIKSPTPNSDLISLVTSTPAVATQAIGPVQANGAQRQGAFPESTTALNQGTPELAFARPYAPDLQGWFDDFSHSGIADALGGASRAQPDFNAFANVQGLLQPIPPALRASVFNSVASLNQRNRCPGAADHGTVFKPSPDFNCDPTQTLPGS